jgi:pimeloyl-ACP methyl ester carboxylesterase
VFVVFAALLWHGGAAQEHVSFATDDGGSIRADVYGEGDRGVVLAHGGRFNKGSWAKQARALAEAGFRVVAVDFRGYGESTGPGQSDPLAAPLYLDLLAAVRYLKANGATTVSVVGASMGGGAAGDASIRSAAGDIDRVVFLASPAAWHSESVEGVKGRKLFIVARDDADGSGQPRLGAIRKHYEEVSEPKRLVVLDGSAHAQFIFDTDQGDRAMTEIIEFLSAP